MGSMNKRVVVTGGAGFIGSHLVDLLVARDYQVVVLDNLSTGTRDQVHPDAALVVADVTRRAELIPHIHEGDLVFHLAGSISVPYSLAHPEETYITNVGGVVNVLSVAKEAHSHRVVFISSAAVYGNQDVPVSEDARPRPLSPYGIEKLVGEQYCQLFSRVYGLSTVSIRPFNIYGPRQTSVDGALIPTLITKSKRGEPLTIVGSGEQLRDFVYVADVVRALAAVGEAAQPLVGEVFNAGSGVGTPVIDVAKLIGGSIEHLPARTEIQDSVADIAAIARAVSWKPTVALEEGIQRTKETFHV